jgi:hypothetical protein
MKHSLALCVLLAACSKPQPTTTPQNVASSTTTTTAAVQPAPCSQEQTNKLQCEEVAGPGATCYVVDANAAGAEQATAKLRATSGCSAHKGLAGAWCCSTH